MNKKHLVFKWLAGLITIAMFLQSVPILPSVSAQQTDSQLCDWTDPTFADFKIIVCKLESVVDTSAQITNEESFAPETFNSLELSSNTPTVPWIVSVGSVGTEINDVAADTSGNVFVTGTITTTTDSNAFVKKLDSGGTIQWSYTFGGMTYDKGHGIAVDDDGNVFITGATQTYFDVNDTGIDDILVAKLSGDGSLLWTNTYGNTTQYDYGWDISLDGSGNVYVTGGSWDLWGSPIRPHTLGQYDAFVAKFSPNTGSLIWNTFLGENLNSNGSGIVADLNGNVYVTGRSFIPGSTSDVFVAGLTANGSALWFTTAGSAGVNERGSDIALDENGNVYVAGENGGAGGSNALVQKLGNGGNIQWSVSIGGAGFDLAYGIDVDVVGNIYVSGISTDLWGDPFPSGTGLPQKVFTAKMDTNGGLVWNTFIKGEAWYQSAGHPNRIAVHGGSIYTASHINTADSSLAFLTKINESGTSEQVQIEITDSTGNPVSALSLNSEGWPTPNPLMVNVTLNCPAGGMDCDHYTFDFNLTPSSGFSRFFPYHSARHSDEAGTRCSQRRSREWGW